RQARLPDQEDAWHLADDLLDGEVQAVSPPRAQDPRVPDARPGRPELRVGHEQHRQELTQDLARSMNRGGKLPPRVASHDGGFPTASIQSRVLPQSERAFDAGTYVTLVAGSPRPTISGPSPKPVPVPALPGWMSGPV